jgi:hypothetical protein
MTRRLSLLLLTALLLAGSGCGTPALEPKGTVSIKLDGVNKRGALTAVMLDEVRLDLPPVTTPGYAWEIFLLDHRYLRITSPLTRPNAEGIQTIKVLTVRPGRTLMRFLLVKENATASDPLSSQEVQLTVEAG